jgi:hypothetical protein
VKAYFVEGPDLPRSIAVYAKAIYSKKREQLKVKHWSTILGEAEGRKDVTGIPNLKVVCFKEDAMKNPSVEMCRHIRLSFLATVSKAE